MQNSAEQAGLSTTWSEASKTGFLVPGHGHYDIYLFYVEIFLGLG